MGWLRKRREERTVPAFRQCPGCGYDILTGEGTKGCSWFECPYLPEDLKVLCPECNYNFATAEGRPHCADPPTCEWAVEGYKHAEILRKTLDRQDAPEA